MEVLEQSNDKRELEHLRIVAQILAVFLRDTPIVVTSEQIRAFEKDFLKSPYAIEPLVSGSADEYIITLNFRDLSDEATDREDDS
jgi:hypothetical protein